jgi:dipeptidyl aminopeptidase/acylaminoacyl peptidase
MRTPQKRITADDLYRMEVISALAISPDGRSIMYSVQRVDRKTQKKYANLWCVDTVSGEVRQFTYGDQYDSTPKWAPSGDLIAFLSNRKNETQPQLYIIRFDGGEARCLTNLKGEFGAFEWSPDGKTILSQFRKKDPEAIDREKDEQAKKLGIVDRHIRRTFYKLDSEGYLPNERWHLWLINARSGQGNQLTTDNAHDEWDPAWAPDGRHIAFCSNHSPDPDLDPDAVDLFVMDVSAKETVRIDTPYGEKRLPSFSPDGDWIAYFGTEGRGRWWQNQRVWKVPVSSASGPAVNLTKAYDITVESLTLNDIGTPTLMPPTWDHSGSKLFFQVLRHGNTSLYTISADGAQLDPVVSDDGVVGAYYLSEDQDRLGYIWGTLEDPCQIWLLDLRSKSKRKLTAVNGKWLPKKSLGEVKETWFQGPDGSRLHGWILHPPDFNSRKQYPAVIGIHGGPLLQYGNLFMHEFQFLAANGYVVAFCNPRGGQGYGETHAKAIWNAWGTSDYEDIMAWADYVSSLPYVDPERMGVSGGSYGGFLTNWIIGHTNRFRAAVSQRSVSNQASMWGSSDFNWAFQMEVGDDKPPWENIDLYWKLSPMKYVGNASTPTLIIHSEQDLRCAIEQGEQMYVALRTLGVDTEFVVFPDESHGLSRTGRTDRRVARLQHILRWFDRYLKSGTDS